MSSSHPVLSQGQVVEGFTIGSLLRTRAGAATYTATDASGAAVHFTAYGAECFPSALVRERSLRELRQMQAIKDPAIVDVVAAGKLEADGGLYEVTQAVTGETLEGHTLTKSDAAAAISRIGDALLAAQKGGIIHRNLGSAVVIRGAQGIQVCAFAVGEPHGGVAFGPLGTMAPEQAQGKVVDQRSLIYNLGALAHELTTGTPLYTGSTAEVIAAHIEAPLPAGVDPAFARGLAKDAKQRPMMLKQFISDALTALGGAPATANASGAAAKPSTRGWTMFMEAADDGGAAPAAPAPAPVAAAPVAAAPVAAAPAAAAAPVAAGGAVAKPSTRGWTMFMDAADDGGAAPAAAAVATPVAAPVVAPVAASAAPAPAAADRAAPAVAKPAVAKPSTRGWTMFMDEEPAPAAAEPPAQPAAAPAVAPTPAPAPVAPVSTPVSVAPVAAAAAAVNPPSGASPSAPTAAGAAGGVPKPSTRGWTMFMDEEPAAPAAASAGAPAAASAAASAPSAPAFSPAPADLPPPPVFSSAPAPVATAPVATAPVATAPVATAPVATAPVATAPTPAAASPAPGDVPSTRGWTMFGDASGDAPGPAPAAAPEPVAAATPQPAAAAPTPAAGPGPAGAAPSTRGWTMFMEAPLPSAEEGAAPQSAPAQAPAAEPEGSIDGASDNKGWTVFMDKAPVFTPPAGAKPAAGPMGFAPSASAGPTSAGSVESKPAAPAAAAQAATGGGRTVVVQGGAIPSASKEDTTYYQSGSQGPERVGSITRDAIPVHTPSRPVVEERNASAGQPNSPAPSSLPAPSQGASMAPGRSAPVATRQASTFPVVPVIIGGVVLVAIIVTLVMMMT